MVGLHVLKWQGRSKIKNYEEINILIFVFSRFLKELSEIGWGDLAPSKSP